MKPTQTVPIPLPLRERCRGDTKRTMHNEVAAVDKVPTTCPSPQSAIPVAAYKLSADLALWLKYGDALTWNQSHVQRSGVLVVIFARRVRCRLNRAMLHSEIACLVAI